MDPKGAPEIFPGSEIMADFQSYTATVNCTTYTKEFESYKGYLNALILLKRDTILIERNHEVSIREVTVQLDQVIVEKFIPVLGPAPQFPELRLERGTRVVEGEVLVNGAPCAVQSTCDPTGDRLDQKSYRRIGSEPTYE